MKEAAACEAPGDVGALLRREGLYSSQLATWRRQLQRYGEEGLAAKRRDTRRVCRAGAVAAGLPLGDLQHLALLRALRLAF